MAKAWTYQDGKQVKKHGADKVSWFVGWFDPEGKKRCKSCGPGCRGKSIAEKERKRIEAELLTGTYQSAKKKTWAEFRQEWEARIGASMDVRTRAVTLDAFNHFERLVKPKLVAVLKTQTLDDYTAKRRSEPGRKRGDIVSPFTVNKELRHLRAALNVAGEWGYLLKAPKVRMLKEPGKLPTYVSPEHFAMIYGACDKSRMPVDLPFPAAEWWRSLLMTAYMTGWRIGDLLAMRKDAVDLEAGTAISWHEDNKGKRDELVKLHPLVVEHLRRLVSFDTVFLPWNHHRRTLDEEFLRIQEAAGIKLPCRNMKHEHTRHCHAYSFHDLRRAFATMNANRLSADALQALMRHKSYQTTQKYINMARQMDEAVAKLYVPNVPMAAGG